MWAPVETTTGSLYSTLKTHHARSDDDASSSSDDQSGTGSCSGSSSTTAESPSSSNSSHGFTITNNSGIGNNNRKKKSSSQGPHSSNNNGHHTDNQLIRNMAQDEEEENNVTSQPASRCKHACCCDVSTGYIFLFAGRSGNTPFRDLWRFDPRTSYWSEIRYNWHSSPPFLQEHTMISWGNKLYVFGGEVGFSSNGETPLWIFDLGSKSWRKAATPAGSLPLGSTSNCPAGRRGHSAVIYDCGMHIYGGYQDLRGSSSELWTFDLTTEQWHLITCSGRSSAQPSGRHYHSAVVYDGSMWVLGGMTDLNERSDFWRWSFVSRQWRKIKANKGPSGIHSHSSIVFRGSMFVFGGERKGQLLHDLWKFNFAGQFWEKITTLQGGMLPNPRSRHTAVGNPFIHLDASTNERIEVTSTEESSSMHSPLSPLDSDVSKRIQQQQQHNSLAHSSSLTDPAAVTMNPSRLLHQQPRQEGESILNPEKQEQSMPQDEKENESNHRFPGIRMRRRRKNRLISSKDRPMSDFILECASPEKVAADAAAAVANNDVHYKNRMANTLGTSMFPEETEWPVFGQNKRYTVHESMSYYALCFPSPQLSSSIQRKANQVNGHFDNRDEGGGKNNSISLVRPVSPKFSSFRPQQNENSCYTNQSSNMSSNVNTDSNSNGNSGSSNYNSSSSNSNNNNIHMNSNNNSRSSSSSSSNSGSNESSTAVSPDALLAPSADSRVPIMRNQTDLLLQTRAFDVDVDAACLELRIQSPPALSHALLSQNAEVARRRRRSRPHPPATRRTIDTFDPSSLDFTCEFEEDDLLNCISQSRSVNFDSIVSETKMDKSVQVKKCTPTPLTFNNNENSINCNNNNNDSSSNSNNNNNNNNGSNSNSSTLSNGKMANASSNANSSCHNSQHSSHFNSGGGGLQHHQVNANANTTHHPVSQSQEVPSVILPIRRAWSAYSPSKFNLMNYVNSGCKSNNRLDSRCSGVGGGGNLHQSSQAVCSSSTVTTTAAGEKTCNSNDWQLCMYVFGGREDGATFAYKQPISVWKLYI